MTTAAESRREAARGNGTTGGQFGFQDHTPPGRGAVRRVARHQP